MRDSTRRGCRTPDPSIRFEVAAAAAYTAAAAALPTPTRLVPASRLGPIARSIRYVPSNASAQALDGAPYREQEVIR
jgi:hypothetical protein